MSSEEEPRASIMHFHKFNKRKMRDDKIKERWFGLFAFYNDSDLGRASI